MGEAIAGDGEWIKEKKKGDQYPPHVRYIHSAFSAVVAPINHTVSTHTHTHTRLTALCPRLPG